MAICLEQLSDPHPLLRQWVAICLGRTWQNFDSARWCGVRDSAHEKLCNLLSDPIPEVSSRLGDQGEPSHSLEPLEASQGLWTPDDGHSSLGTDQRGIAWVGLLRGQCLGGGMVPAVLWV